MPQFFEEKLISDVTNPNRTFK